MDLNIFLSLRILGSLHAGLFLRTEEFTVPNFFFSSCSSIGEGYRSGFTPITSLSPCSNKSFKNRSILSGLPHPYWSQTGTSLHSLGIAGSPLLARKCPWPLVPTQAWSTFVSLNPDWLAAAIFPHCGGWRQFFQWQLPHWGSHGSSIPHQLIQALGHWTSNAHQLYIRTPSEALAGISSPLAWHPVSLSLRVPFVICSAFNIAAELST